MGLAATEAVARLRRDATHCLLAGVAAVEPQRLVRNFVTCRPELFRTAGRLYLAALGKAAAAMSSGALESLPQPVDGGVAVLTDQQDASLPGSIAVVRGSHPLPGRGSLAAGTALLDLAAKCRRDDLLIVLASGGGSSLACAPPPAVTLDTLVRLTTRLLAAGASIEELNAVRQHLDLLKGGGLAAAASPARVVGLVLSDVIGDRLELVASGPSVPSTVDQRAAVDVLRRYGLWDELSEPVRQALAASAPAAPGGGVNSNHLVGGNRLALDAVLAACEALSYRPALLSSELRGEASRAGRWLATSAIARRRDAAAATALVAGGETTVQVLGDGRGGRNQELALAAALAIDGEPSVVVASLGSDGIDGPTDAAGAVVDGGSAQRMRQRGIDPRDALTRNDSHTALAASGDLLVTGPTGTNVADLQIALLGADA